MTVHVVIADTSKLNTVISEIKAEAQRYGITHVTVEAETGSTPCNDRQMFSND